MNEMTAVAKPRGARARKPAGPVEIMPPTVETPIQIAPSVPRLVPLGNLRRAPENIRHTRSDEDTVGMADDIAAHGLLQSLIGYDGSWPEDQDLSFIVGGGRRLGGLLINRDRGLCDDGFLVPVLIRPQAEAIELSLSESLQQRNISPVDEFLAFKLLMATGTNSPATIAARFGLHERLVKQRLRLADLAPEILDALAERRITIDAAMAFAKSEDREVQSAVFKAHARPNAYQPFAPDRIARDVKSKGMDTSDRVFKFIGPKAYERAGGEYEDDLFNDPDAPRVLKHPHLVEPTAHEMIDFQMVRLLIEAQRDEELSPTIDGYVRVPDLAINTWGTQAKFTAPPGFAQVDRYGHEKIWKTIRNNRIPAKIVVGINPAGELIIWPKIMFVPKEQKAAVDPQHDAAPVQAPRPLTEEERAAARREAAITEIAWRKGVGSFDGTPLAGRAFWPIGRWTDPFEAVPANHPQMPFAGQLVSVQIYVTETQMQACMQDAIDAYERREAERRAAEAASADAKSGAEKLQERSDTLLAMDPPPAVVMIGDDAWARQDDGSYAVIGDEGESFVAAWDALLANYDVEDIGETFANLADFDNRALGDG